MRDKWVSVAVHCTSSVPCLWVLNKLPNETLMANQQWQAAAGADGGGSAILQPIPK